MQLGKNTCCDLCPGRGGGEQGREGGSSGEESNLGLVALEELPEGSDI